MFNKWLSTIKSNSHASKEEQARRKFSRRRCDKCVTVINGKTYPVEDWSLGGLLLYTDSRAFGLNDEIDLTVKFRLRNEVLDLRHKAHVVRKNSNHVALEFAPLTDPVKNGFQSVVDDHVATQFAESHAISSH